MPSSGNRGEPQEDRPSGHGLRTGTSKGQGQNQDFPPSFQAGVSRTEGSNFLCLLYLLLLSSFLPFILLTSFFPSFFYMALAIDNCSPFLKQNMLSISHLRTFVPTVPSLQTTLAIPPCLPGLNLDITSFGLVEGSLS